VVEIRLPPLRERVEDLPLLLGRWIESTGGQISADAVALLQTHNWPGNVRELRNVWERARALAGNEIVEPRHLASITRPQTMKPVTRPQAASTPAGAPDPTEGSLVGKSLAEIERLAIAATLAANKGNKSATARDLGIAYSTLLEKLKRYGI
jgi:DNA-binding NtrC family response regulator